MKKALLFLTALVSPFAVMSQCTTTNATTCQCPATGATDCDLLPDITISWSGILNYKGGPNEYPQTCNPACNGNDGRLRLSASTPNIGFGPLTVRGSSTFVCGTDTMQSNPGTCPDGSTPRQLITQRVYHKNGNTMSYYDRWAGAMTYHPSHGHNHVDDWGVFSLRIKDPNEQDPRKWPVVATGGKLGFCLMDYYQCGDPSAVNHCKDVNTVYNQGTSLVNSNFPNFGLGGGQYNCSPVEQGISSGYTDVYDEDLDLMWINLPDNLCNGQYWIVIDVDPHNNFLERDETNNYTAVPFTLTQQNPANTPAPVVITANKPSRQICQGDSIQLTATAGTSFLWNTGATTQSIWVKAAGDYSATVTNYCGTATSSPYKVIVNPLPTAPVVLADTVCGPGAATLTASASGTITWYDSNGVELSSGTSYTTPTLTSSTTYYVQSSQTLTDTSHVGPESNDYGTGGYLTGTAGNGLMFSTFAPVTLVSVKVYSQSGGSQTIQLRDSMNNLVNTTTVSVPSGSSRVTLNWNIPAGNSWKLAGASTNGLYRNNTNSTDYPYVLDNAVAITGSSAGPAYYYYFYDWEVKTQHRTCNSATVPVTAVVQTCTGIDERSLDNAISLYPNPSKDVITLELSLPGTSAVDIMVCDLTGSQVMNSTQVSIAGKGQTQLDIHELPAGAYFVNVRVGARVYVRKLIKN